MNFTNYLNKNLKKYGIKKNELAKEVGISPQSMSGYSNGKHTPSDDVKASVYGYFKKIQRREEAKRYYHSKKNKQPEQNAKQEAKQDSGKPQLSLVPQQGIVDVAQVREYGLAKYGDSENWKSVDPKRYIDALYRHLLEVVNNPTGKDEESGIEHYKHIACNAMFLCELLKNDNKEEKTTNE